MRTLTIKHNGVTYIGSIATIESTRLGVEDHGILTTYLMLKWDGAGQGSGGIALDEPARHSTAPKAVLDDRGKYDRIPTAYGADFIARTMWAVGVDKWEDLKGKHVIHLQDKPFGSAKGLAHLTDESRVLIYEEHADLWGLDD